MIYTCDWLSVHICLFVCFCVFCGFSFFSFFVLAWASSLFNNKVKLSYITQSREQLYCAHLSPPEGMCGFFCIYNKYICLFITQQHATYVSVYLAKMKPWSHREQLDDGQPVTSDGDALCLQLRANGEGPEATKEAAQHHGQMITLRRTSRMTAWGTGQRRLGTNWKGSQLTGEKYQAAVHQT